MELVMIAGIAVIVLYLVSQGSGVAIKGNLSASRLPYSNSSYPEFQPLPQTSLNSTGYSSDSSGLVLGSIAMGANTTAGMLSSMAQAGSEAAKAVPIVGAIAAVATQLLAAHQARLKGATSENNAALHIVPAYDDFISQLTSAYQTGQVTPQQMAAALASFDQSLYQQLRSLVGAPGTAWSDSAGMAGKCDKTCTVSCCLYYSDLGPPLSLMRYILGDRSGKWGADDPRLNLNARTVQVPKVYPGKYSQFSRAAYTVQL